MKLRPLLLTLAVVACPASVTLAQNEVRPPNEGPVTPVPQVADPDRPAEASAVAEPAPATPDESTFADRPNLVAILSSADDFTMIAKAIQAAGQEEMLKGTGPYTVFAPTNQAFSALPEGELETLLKPESRERLAALLGRHIVKGRVTLDGAEPGPLPVSPLSGTEMQIRTTSGVTTIASVVVSRQNIVASNGVIHVVDSVLPSSNETVAPVTPPTAVEEGVIIERVEVEVVEEP